MNHTDPSTRHLRLAPTPQPGSGVTGEEAEDASADVLDDLSEGAVFLLRDRRIPGSRSVVDRLAVVPGGVWVIGVQRGPGLVEQRSNGKGAPPSLVAGGTERTLLVERTARQVDQVRRAIFGSAGPDVQIRGALCFVGADWRLFATSFAVDGILVASPRTLVRTLSEPGDLGQARRERLRRQLSAALPPAGSSFARV